MRTSVQKCLFNGECQKKSKSVNQTETVKQVSSESGAVGLL